MSNLNRRDALNVLGAASIAGFGLASSPTKAEAQTSIFRFAPDGKAQLGGKPIGIDIALLGPNGEETAGFYASLDPFHGTPFKIGWLNFYGPWLMDDPQNFNAWDPRPLTDSEARNTSTVKINHIISHLSSHGFRFEQDLKPLYDWSLIAWKARPDLRLNAPHL